MVLSCSFLSVYPWHSGRTPSCLRSPTTGTRLDLHLAAASTCLQCLCGTPTLLVLPDTSRYFASCLYRTLLHGPADSGTPSGWRYIAAASLGVRTLDQRRRVISCGRRNLAWDRYSVKVCACTVRDILVSGRRGQGGLPFRTPASRMTPLAQPGSGPFPVWLPRTMPLMLLSVLSH